MKKNRNNNYSLLLLCSLLLVSIASNAQVNDSKRITKTFQVDKSTIVDISNKYGDITIDTWDKDSVWVEINYQVTDKNYERLRKKMEEISFELTQSGHFVVINTLISSSKNMLIDELIKLKETIGVGESQVEIDMKIKLPDNLNLRIKNKYGNIYIDDYIGELTFDLSNGRLKAHDLTGYVNLKISFGDAIINTIDTGNLEIYYSELNLADGRKLRINSKTSDITITEVSQLLVNSSRDDYRIRMISNFETESSWTDFSITEFTNRSDIKMNYGDLTIENIRPSIDNMLIDAKSTKINLFFDKEMDVNFDITTNKDISLPMEAKIDSTQQIDEKEKIVRYFGRTGNIKIGKPKLTLKTTEANISILKR